MIRFFSRAAIILFTLFGTIGSLIVLLNATAQALPINNSPTHPSNLPSLEFPVITETSNQDWVGISGDCIAFRDDRVVTGGVYLYNLSTQETITISEKSDADVKVVISQGMVVWNSEQADAPGLWGYYNPTCSDSGYFGNDVIAPFHILNRGQARGVALSGETLTYMGFAPVGFWHILLIELDSDNNGVPDAIEAGYDPAGSNFLTRLSCCAGGVGSAQVLPDVYWDNDYKVACWFDDAGVDHISCYDLGHDEDGDGLFDWQDSDFGNPWNGQFTVSEKAHVGFDWQGVIAVHRDLVVWTDIRDNIFSGHNLYILDLDVDNDTILNVYDDDFNPDIDQTEFVLVNFPWEQQHPDIWWPYVVWTDRRNDTQNDIYYYDLTLDSDGDGIANWRDPNRECHDAAEIRLTTNDKEQFGAEVWGETAVWETFQKGNWDIYGATLEPVIPQPRPTLTGTPIENAQTWLDLQTITYDTKGKIPGYITATDMVTRYKSFTNDAGETIVRRAWYPAIPGSYIVGFDFCYFGTPDQKQLLGRPGRGFTYDQGLGLIAHTMFNQQDKARTLGQYVSSFQNNGQADFMPAGSFGYSFNGTGFWGEKDNFYDMDYLRTGANAWLGYGYWLYQQTHPDDTQFADTLTGITDYVLAQQVITPGHPQEGLVTGGRGTWLAHSDTFRDTVISWASAEHNIDTYFLFRDVGLLTGDKRYTDAAKLLKANMEAKLWNPEKGRLNQGLNVTGTVDMPIPAPDTTDALDAASWGAIYWIAIGDLSKAMNSLDYAERSYRSTVTVSNTVTATPEITVWGYKPHSELIEGLDWANTEFVWSEGSLGVAMASLKLGYALKEQCSDDLHGNIYLQRASNIVAEMEKLQTLDPNGGLFYAAYAGKEIDGFARAPSAAGTTWFLMVKRALEEEQWRNAFWGSDPDVTWMCPGTRYVAETGSDNGNTCTNSEMPCATIQHAVETAVSGDEIRVAAGEYTDLQVRNTTTQTVFLNKTLTLLGGFTTDNWETADPTNNPTILNAQHQGRVFYITGDNTVTISGFHITGGNAANQGNNGGGLYAETAQVALFNNQIYDNWGFFRADGENGSRGNGGGLYFNNSPHAILQGNHIYANRATLGGGVFLQTSPFATVSNNLIEDNVANHVGSGLKHYGGLYVNSSSRAVIENNIVRRNHAENDCGGICVKASHYVVIRGNLIEGNYAGKSGFVGGGGGVLIADTSQNTLLEANIIRDNHGVSYAGGVNITRRSQVTMINNVVINNHTDNGGFGSGMALDQVQVDGWHNTIAGNSDGDGSGIYVNQPTDWQATAVFTNTILANHTVGVLATTTSTVTLDGVLWHNNANPIGGAGSVIVSNEYTGDPAFATDGYHLTAVSPAINTCTPSTITTDIDGDPRPLGTACDLGADEVYLGLVANKQTQTPLALAEQPLVYTLQLTNTSDITLTAMITDILPSGVTTTEATSWEVTLMPNQVWEQTLTVTVGHCLIQPLINEMQVTTNAGIGAGATAETAVSRRPCIYLPLIQKQ